MTIKTIFTMIKTWCNTSFKWIKNQVIVILGAISSILGILFAASLKKQTETKQKLKEEENKTENLTEKLEKQKSQLQTLTQEKKENEELKNAAYSGVNNDSFNASVELLHNTAAKGRNRNKSE